VKRCCLTALRQCSGGRFFLLSRSRAFGKARARAAEKTQENKLPKYRGWGMAIRNAISKDFLPPSKPLDST
jgi:hypothetical protein